MEYARPQFLLSPQAVRRSLSYYMAMNRFLITAGTVFIVVGLLCPWVKRVPLFRLPGDLVIDRPGFKFVLPITTMLIVSVVLSVVAWLIRR